MNVLMVCSGNICRSPLAELLLARELSDMPDIRVSSAGTFAGPGEMMPEQSQLIAFGLGLDPTMHRARFLEQRLVEDSDLVFAMTRSQRSQVVQMAPRRSSRVFTLREFARLSGGITNGELDEIGQRFAPAEEKVAAILDLAVSRRPLLASSLPTTEDDVVDPYRKSDEIYELSTSQIVPSVFEVARVLGRGLRTPL